MRLEWLAHKHSIKHYSAGADPGFVRRGVPIQQSMHWELAAYARVMYIRYSNSYYTLDPPLQCIGLAWLPKLGGHACHCLEVQYGAFPARASLHGDQWRVQTGGWDQRNFSVSHAHVWSRDRDPRELNRARTWTGLECNRYLVRIPAGFLIPPLFVVAMYCLCYAWSICCVTSVVCVC